MQKKVLSRFRRQVSHRRQLRIEPLERRSMLAAFIVTTAVDENDTAPIVGAGLSLREAIGLANVSVGADTITFDSVAFASGRTITLDQAFGQLAISDSLTITGTGRDLLTIDAAGKSRVMKVTSSSVDLTLSDLTITGGKTTANSDSGAGIGFVSTGMLSLSNAKITGNAATGSSASAGGILVSSGSLQISDSEISGNSSGSRGGGIYAFFSPKSTITNSIISTNTAGTEGGGIGSCFGDLSILNSTVSGNVSLSSRRLDGAGIYAKVGTLSINASTISNNLANYGDGAGLGVTGSTVTIVDSTISKNTVVNGYGGGVSATSSTVSLTNSTISENRSSVSNAGGLHISQTKFSSNSSTITSNTAALDGGGIFAEGTTNSLTIHNSIIAGNTDDGTSPDLYALQTPAANLQLKSSLIGNNSGSTLVAAAVADLNGNLVGSSAVPINPQLGPLQNNGGMTETHALQVGSPAINSGNDALLLDGLIPIIADQRGLPFTRMNGTIDMGAYEYHSVAPSFLTVNTTVDELNYGNANLSLREAINSSNTGTGERSINFDPIIFATPQQIALTLGELAITRSVVISGPGEQLLKLNAQGTSRVINFTAPAGNLSLSGLSIYGGQTTADDADGAGIRFASDGILFLADSTVSGNKTLGRTADGGGLYSRSGNIFISNSTLATNSVAGYGAGGGAIATFSGSVSLTDSVVTGNNTKGDRGFGGGVVTYSGAVILSDTVVSDNKTTGFRSAGGGVATTSGAVSLTNSTLSGNQTSGEQASGGGFVSGYGVVTLTNSTLSGNQVTSASSEGGGLWVNNSAVTIQSSTITANSAAGTGGGMGMLTSAADKKLTIFNSIIAGNTDAGIAPDFVAPTSPATNLEVKSSLVGDNTGTSLAAAQTADPNGNLVGTTATKIDPKLGPLQINGGPTQTHALLTGSPALDKGNAALLTSDMTTDQRGWSRKTDLAAVANAATYGLDMGAVEMVGASIAAISRVENAGSLDFTITLSNAIPAGQSVTIRFDTANITGQAIGGTDYTAVTNRTITFTGGDSLTQTTSVSINDDTLIENDETLTATLSNSNGAVITVASVVGTIQSDDSSLSIAATALVKPEANTAFSFTVSRSTGLSGIATATYTVTGSGPNPIDLNDVGGYIPTGMVVLNAGQSSQQINFYPSADLTIEPDENFKVTLSNPSAGDSFATNVATGIILNDDIGYAIAAGSAVKPEGDSGTTPFTFTVTRTGLTTGSSQLNYAVTGSTVNGASPADFSAGVFPSGTVSFSAGETSKLLTINALPETLLEASENFVVTLNNPGPSGSISTATATGTIQNDDFASLAIAATAATQTEGNSGQMPFTFTVTRSGSLNGVSTAIYKVAAASPNLINITDVGGSVPTGTVTFNSGESSKVITINVTGDTTVEPDENFQISLSSPSTATTITTATAYGKILNDDTGYSIAATSAIKTEGISGSTPFTFTVFRSGLITSASTVDFAVTGSAINGATAADFAGGTFPTGTVNFAAGQSSQLLTVNVLGETLFESDEGFIVTVSLPNPPGTITTALAIGMIQNDDAILAIAATSAVKAEGSSGTTPFTFTVTRSGSLAAVSSATYNVNATGPHYIDITDVGGFVPSGTVTFNAGESSKLITINVTGDATSELDESFKVTLSNPSNGTSISTNVANGTILNDDFTYAIVATSAAKAEGNSATVPFTFTVTRSGYLGSTTTVNYAVTGAAVNSAAAADFAGNVFPTGTITFSPGVANQLISINVQGESVFESDEGFVVTLNSANPAAAITTAAANGSILNDDATLAISATAAVKTEGNSGSTPFTFTVTRSGNLSGVSTASYSVTATGPNLINITDVGGFVPSGIVSFATGESSKVVTINVTGDTSVELDESFKVTLSGPNSGTTITTAIAVGTIQNDDTGYAIAASSAVKAEGSSGTTPFTFIVTRNGVTGGASTVNFAVTASATNGTTASDFDRGMIPSGTISFLANETSKLITINVFADTLVELSEGFIVTLNSPSGQGSLITATATATIQNDD